MSPESYIVLLVGAALVAGESGFFTAIGVILMIGAYLT